MVPSSLPLASVCPSGLNATELTAPRAVRVRGWPSGLGCAGSATSHSRIVPSPLPPASVCPSGLNATELMAAVPPVRGWPSGRGCAGSATSHSRTVPSVLPPASVCPSGLNATELMPAVPPVRGWPSGRGCAGSATSHSRTVPPLPPLASVCPSGLNATELMGRAAGQGLAERARVHGVGDIPQPDRAAAAPPASVCPSGLNATESTSFPIPYGCRPPVRNWLSRRGCAGSVTSHSRTALSAARRWPAYARRG